MTKKLVPENKHNHVLVLLGGQFANDSIEHIRSFGRDGWNTKVLIFTRSIEMNMPLMKKEPGIVLWVGEFIPSLMQAINGYLKFAKTDYKKDKEFGDVENIKSDPLAKELLDE